MSDSCDSMDCSPPASMGFSRQEYWSGLPFPSPRDLPDPGIEPGSPVLQVDSLLSEQPGKPIKGIHTGLSHTLSLYWNITTHRTCENVLRCGIVKETTAALSKLMFPKHSLPGFFFFFIQICSIKKTWRMAGMEIPTGANAGLANSMISEYSWKET